MTFLTWIANGFFVLLFFLADHLASIGLLASCGYFAYTCPPETRSWAAGVGLLALAISALSPSPIPLMLLALSLGGWVVLTLEQYSRSGRRWDILKGLGIYSGIGGLYTIYCLFLQNQLNVSQGAGYINAIVTILTYVWPVGTLGFWLQAIFAHPPGLGKPEDLIAQVRTRGK